MAEGEKARLVAWSRELSAVHQRLREALRVTEEALAGGDEAEPLTLDLLVFCHGFCTALTGHHEGEDRELFPAIAATHPELHETLRSLEQDHSMIAYLLTELRAALDRGALRTELVRHVEGIGAIMENHFRYEERKLSSILDTLALDADPKGVLGPL